MAGFFELLRVQRWDDHRYYHHSEVNQALHLLSAISFLCAYALIFGNPALAGLIGWLISMTSRQIGHFFFEPGPTTQSTRSPTHTRSRSRLAITSTARSC